MGGAVTTYRAGMAVPDWPSTFGYWFFYPLHMWLAVWDVFLEHGHRLLGMVVGATSIALLVALWWKESRRSVTVLGAITLVAICVQGLFGGLRVVFDQVILANVHGCSAPLVFALASVLVVVTSSAWMQGPKAVATAPRVVRRWSLVFAVLVYLQIVLGAQLRHPLPDADMIWFVLFLWAHVIVAFGALFGVVWLLVVVARRCRQPMLVRRMRWLVALVSLQFVLGLLTWLVKYGVPQWFADYVWAASYTVVTKGDLQGLITTLHVAVGSLSLILALGVCLWTHRLGAVEPSPVAADGAKA
jgi:heme a synthase